MTLIVLVSGGLDSSLAHVLAREQGIDTHALFIDYGQRAAEAEWKACRTVHGRLGLPAPTRMNLAGFGALVPSGLTDSKQRLVEDAFLPGRNLLFLVAGASFARVHGGTAVVIGLLHEDDHLFPDQTAHFLAEAQVAIETAHGQSIRLLAPLMHMHKADVIALAEAKGIRGTYSCHAGGDVPCGVCISCREFLNASNALEN